MTDDDNDLAFYIPPPGTVNARRLGYCDNGNLDPDVCIRITPGAVTLPKGEPVNFTVHVKAQKDFCVNAPLVLRLSAVEGTGTAVFLRPDETKIDGFPELKLDQDRIIITMMKSDNAARVVIKTEYPGYWWAGFTKVSVEIVDVMGIAQNCVEANITVTARVPAAWSRYGDARILN